MAWRAALGRDMPILVIVTLLLTSMAACANVAADLVCCVFAARHEDTRRVALSFLIVTAVLSLAAGFIAPHRLRRAGSREPNAPGLPRVPLGADEWARPVLAPSGGQPRFAVGAPRRRSSNGARRHDWDGRRLVGGWADEAATVVIDLFLSLPWLFAVLTLRALLPLNFPPGHHVAAISCYSPPLDGPPGSRRTRRPSPTCAARARFSRPRKRVPRRAALPFPSAAEPETGAPAQFGY